MKGASIVFAALLVSTVAQADVVTQPESPRTSALQLKLGSFNPKSSIDEGATTGPGPYQASFGSSGMLLFEMQYDRYLWQRVGALGLGLSAGYAEKYGHASVLGTTKPQETNVKTALIVSPLKLTAVYNFDYAALKWHVPLVPYVRGGVALVPWWSLKNGKVEYVEGDRGAGAKWGWTATGGVALLLDVLEPRMARDFDTDLGVNHTYAFAEYAMLNAGTGKGPDLASNNLMLGLSFEF